MWMQVVEDSNESRDYFEGAHGQLAADVTIANASISSSFFNLSVVLSTSVGSGNSKWLADITVNETIRQFSTYVVV